MSQGGAWTASCYLNLQGLHLDYRCLQFLCIFLIKVTNNCGHSVSPAAFRYKIYRITVSTLGKIVHIAFLPSSIYYHLNPHFLLHICAGQFLVVLMAFNRNCLYMQAFVTHSLNCGESYSQIKINALFMFLFLFLTCKIVPWQGIDVN